MKKEPSDSGKSGYIQPGSNIMMSSLHATILLHVHPLTGSCLPEEKNAFDSLVKYEICL